MICTVTFNPSLDYIVRVDDMRLGAINRTTYEQVLPGGKGVNVSIVLGNLGHASRALGFVAGFTGDELVRLCAEAGVDCDFIRVERGMTRVNVKVKSAEETELNGMGPQMGEEDVEVLLARTDALGAGDTLVVSGSVPACLPHDMYERVMERVAPRGVRVVVDAERDLLTRTLPLGPFLVKPNNHELGDIFGVELRTRDEVVPYARRLQEMGAANVLVSMAGEGGVLVAETGEVFQSPAAKGTVVNSVGAGDSSVAGFLAGLAETGSYEAAFRMALATGSASAFSDHLATRAEVEALLAG
ncbi:1-phosphofructokinase [Thermophilibacter provencensis]|uniref:1-phosphofructokinase n=1 Tax=Thermophilibacter provencensis TaxID=1852386 RepID=A0A921GE73_9ACTN|nr:1-phosphofructokinase [Thermophilibacter provencensis]HJF44463.1 1-phosphofructokinase [Thermophilibacter provencensis]